MHERHRHPQTSAAGATRWALLNRGIVGDPRHGAKIGTTSSPAPPIPRAGIPVTSTAGDGSPGKMVRLAEPQKKISAAHAWHAQPPRPRDRSVTRRLETRPVKPPCVRFCADRGGTSPVGHHGRPPDVVFSSIKEAGDLRRCSSGFARWRAAVLQAVPPEADSAATSRSLRLTVCR